MLGTQIKPATVANDLGVYIDCHLNFNEHFTKTASDCIFKLTRANRIKHLLDKKNIDLSYKCFRLQQIILLFDGMEWHEQEERWKTSASSELCLQNRSWFKKVRSCFRSPEVP